MDLVIYVLGPILLVVLPLAVVIAGVVAGELVPIKPAPVAIAGIALVAASALGVSSYVRFGADNWVAPWWLAALYGASYDFSLLMFALIVTISLGIFTLRLIFRMER